VPGTVQCMDDWTVHISTVYTLTLSYSQRQTSTKASTIRPSWGYGSKSIWAVLSVL